jgi:hypothetical protein
MSGRTRTHNRTRPIKADDLSMSLHEREIKHSERIIQTQNIDLTSNAHVLGSSIDSVRLLTAFDTSGPNVV